MLFLGVLLVGAMTGAALFRPDIVNMVNSRVYDIFIRALPRTVPSPLPVVVDIDDKSLRQYGQWPWPRYRIARLLSELRNLKARSICLDILFPEPDRTSPAHLAHQLERDYGYHLDLSNIPVGSRSNDTILAKVLVTGPFVLGYKFSFGENATSSCHLHPIPVVVINSKGSSKKMTLLRPKGALCNLSIFSTSVKLSGFTNAMTDRDGMLRSVPLLMTYRGKYYPNLAVAGLMKAFNLSQAVLRVGKNGVESLALGNRVIPLDEQGSLRIRFRGGKNTYRHISAADILTGAADKRQIAGHIVFVGASASGLNDFRATPLDPVFPGVEVYAAIVDNFVQGDFLCRPQGMRNFEWLTGILLGIVSIILLVYGRAALNILFFILSALGLWYGSRWLFESRGLFASPFFPGLILVVNFSFMSALKYGWEEHLHKKQARELLMVQSTTLETIVMVIETRHHETGGHVKRTQHYVRLLAEYLQKNKKYRGILGQETLDLLFHSSPLHDVGKVGIPDVILKKPGRLDPNEFEIMKRHTLYGKMIFDMAEARLGHNSFLSIARTIAYTHHEKWDGSGYPRGLKGEEIPLFGRIMTVADIYDALVSHRVYKTALPHDEAVDLIRSKGGKELDPDVVGAFVALQDKFREIAERFTDDFKGPIEFIASSET